MHFKLFYECFVTFNKALNDLDSTKFMSSIIRNAEKLGITYSVSSKTVGNGNREKVFTDNSSFFKSGISASDQWWQVSFTRAVLINSYTIKSSLSGYQSDLRPKSWKVIASMNGVQWETADQIAEKDTYLNEEIFIPYFTVNCRHFRIIFKENFDDSNFILFTFFDCFGGLGNNNTKKVRYNQCYCNTIQKNNNNLSFRVMFYLMMISAQ